jgi:hypothetical protein
MLRLLRCTTKRQVAHKLLGFQGTSGMGVITVILSPGKEECDEFNSSRLGAVV